MKLGPGRQWLNAICGIPEPTCLLAGDAMPPLRLMAPAQANLGESLCSIILITSSPMVGSKSRHAFPFKAVLMLSNVCWQVSLPKTRSQICDIFVSYGLMKLTGLENSFYRCEIAGVFIRGWWWPMWASSLLLFDWCPSSLLISFQEGDQSRAVTFLFSMNSNIWKDDFELLFYFFFLFLDNNGEIIQVCTYTRIWQTFCNLCSLSSGDPEEKGDLLSVLGNLERTIVTA